MANQSRGSSPGFGALLGLGLTLGACVGGGTFLGVLADEKWSTSPLYAIVGLVLGVLAAVGIAFAEMRRYF